MKNTEAIENLKAILEECTTSEDAVSYVNSEDAGTLKAAIEALEKQETAKIVVGKSRGGVTLWHECSKCGEPIDAKDIFCRRCGRKLIPLPEPYTEEES